MLNLSTGISLEANVCDCALTQAVSVAVQANAAAARIK